MNKLLFVFLSMAFTFGALAGEPQFTEDGKLMRPDPTEWVFVSSSSTDTSSAGQTSEMAEVLENEAHIIHIDPAAWAHFNKTGEFPEGTIVTASFYSMDNKGMAAPRVWADKLIKIDVGVKDSTRFDGGWGYFSFFEGDKSAEVLPKENCFDCHAAMAAETDFVFTQLYTVFKKDK